MNEFWFLMVLHCRGYFVSSLILVDGSFVTDGRGSIGSNLPPEESSIGQWPSIDHQRVRDRSSAGGRLRRGCLLTIDCHLTVHVQPVNASLKFKP